MTKSYLNESNHITAEHVERVIAKEQPSYRKAYSDRAAFTMACLSEIAYLPWEDWLKGRAPSTKLVIKEAIVAAQCELKDFETLSNLLDKYTTSYSAVRKQLKLDLDSFGIRIDTKHSWVNDPVTGTQALVLFNDENVFICFRGTEPTQIKDIKTDIKAYLVKLNKANNCKVHQGFRDAFLRIRKPLLETLATKNFKDKPIFITGHSLGGALATVATKELTHPHQIAACYTFGSPRVGDDDFVNGIKSPVYRIVNAADAVTMLPFGSVITSLLSLLLGRIPVIGAYLKNQLSKISGYVHGGNMRYLTNCRPEKYETVKLLYSVSFLYRMKGAFFLNPFSKWAGLKLLKDHSMITYRRKLQEIEKVRNP